MSPHTPPESVNLLIAQINRYVSHQVRKGVEDPPIRLTRAQRRLLGVEVGQRYRGGIVQDTINGH